MKELRGKLEFISLWHTIKLTEANGKVLDLRDTCWKVFTALNGSPTTMVNTMNSIEIHSDPESKRLLEFEMKDDTIGIALVEHKLGWSNIGAYLPDMLQRLNGMQVIVTVGDDDKSIKFEHDTDEKVFELNYTNNNSCRISEDDIKNVCKIGTSDCCIFLAVGTNGFSCEKFDSFMARVLLDRHISSTMRASRIGNCKIVGRKE